MKVVCPGCNKEYQIEDHRIPAKGIRMRCTACQATIAVAAPSAATPPAGLPAAAPPPAPRPQRAAATLQGMAPVPPPRPGAAGASRPGAVPAPAAGGPFADLPAPKAGGGDPFGDLPAPKGGGGDPFGDLPAPKAGGGVPFSDLPAAKVGGGDPFGDLPAPKSGGGDPFGDLPAPKGGGGDPFGDLPAPKAGGGMPFSDLPATKSGGGDPFGDLPAPKGGGGPGFADLPAPRAAAGTPFSDLPAPKAVAAPGFADLPAAKAAAAAPPSTGADHDPFADLFPPSPGSRGQPAPVAPPRGLVDLPAVRAPGVTDLPGPRAPGVTDLPGPRIPGVTDLPGPRSGVADLPTLKGGNVDLPALHGGVTDLPRPMADPFAGIDLPASHGAAAAAPRPIDDPFAGLDLPGSGPGSGAPAGGIPVAASAASADPLEMAGAAAAPPSFPSLADAAPGVPRELDLESSTPSTPSFADADEQRGGTAFGELDLGEPADGPGAAFSTAPARPAPAAGTELSLELEGVRPSAPSRTAPRLSATPARAAKADHTGRTLLLLVFVLFLGALVGVPYLLGYGPLGMKLFLGEEESSSAGGGGPGPLGPAPTARADAGAATVAPGADGGSAADAASSAAAAIWGDMPPIDERFLEHPNELVDGVRLEDYVAAGDALLRMQDPAYLTQERAARLWGVHAFNEMKAKPPVETLHLLRELAAKAFERALERNPVAPEAMAGQGRVLLMSGQAEKALGSFEQAVGQDPQNVELLFGQLEALMALSTNDRLPRAEKTLAQIEPLAPEDPRVDLFWGDLQVAYLDWTRARERYHKAWERVRLSRGLGPLPCTGTDCPDAGDAAGDAPAPQPPTAPADEATIDLVYGRLVDFYGRIAILRQAGELNTSPTFREDPTAYLARAGEVRAEGRAMLDLPVALDSRYGVLLGRFAMTTRDPAVLDEARKALEQVRDESTRLLVAPLDPLFYLGLIYRQAKMPAETIDVFTRIESQDPTYPGVFMILVDLKYSPEMLRERLPEDLELLVLEPDNVERLLRVGVEAYFSGQPDLAETKLKRILELQPDSPDANHYLGRLYFDRGDFATAKPFLLRAVETTVTPVASYYLYLGWLHEMEGSYADAVAQLKTAKSLDDQAWQAYWRLGEIYTRLRLSDPDDTPLDLLTKAAELQPDSAEVQASLGRYHDMVGETALAAQHYTRAIELLDAGGELKPTETGAVCTALGKMLQEERPADAEAYFRRALKLGIGIEDEQREREHRPSGMYTARWYWESAYRLAGILRDGNRLAQAATYYKWIIPYVPGQPEETNARRALAVIQQVVPAGQIVDPAVARAAPELP